MAKQPERDNEQPGDVHFEKEIDPVTGFAHDMTIFPAPPLPPEPPPPDQPTFLQRHPYLGPIIGSLLGAIIIGTITIVLFILGKR